jgi:hypothetical protein
MRVEIIHKNVAPFPATRLARPSDAVSADQ